jgi:uncharacterized protein (DUF58 family)
VLGLGQRRARARAIDSGPVTLTQRRIYILPTRAGLLFGLTVVVMLLGCVNYNLGLGYVLTFLMSGVGIVSILHTFRNLVRLQLKPGRPEPVFAGGEALFPVLLANRDALARRSIGLMREGQAPLFVDLGPGQTTTVQISVPAARRGRLPLERLRALTTFPIGLFYAWSNLNLDVHCLVYPRPEAGHVPLPVPRAGDSDGAQMDKGENDFAGLRKYQAGDSLRHVAWKALARGRPVMTKQFSGLAAGELWLEWDALPAAFPIEARLSRLTRWVLEAARAGHTYGLRLPSIIVPPGAGLAHDHQCLTALALFRS